MMTQVWEQKNYDWKKKQRREACERESPLVVDLQPLKTWRAIQTMLDKKNSFSWFFRIQLWNLLEIRKVFLKPNLNLSRQDFSKSFKISCPPRAVVLNQEPLGATESSRGATNVWIKLVFTLNLQLEVLPNCLKKQMKGVVNQKRLRTTALEFHVLFECSLKTCIHSHASKVVVVAAEVVVATVARRYNWNTSLNKIKLANNWLTCNYQIKLWDNYMYNQAYS